MIGGLRAGFEEVLGIERESAYVELARQRIAWWTGYTVPKPAQTNSAPQETPVPPVAGQLNLF